MNLKPLREGQAQALEIILKRIANRESETAIVLPTRYGKSDVIRLASYEAQQTKISSGSLVLSPNLYLRNQMVRRESIDAMIVRYGLDMILAKKLRCMNAPDELNPFSNGEYLLSATMQLACQNIGIFGDFADSRSENSNGPLVVHIDECHQTSQEKRWGELVRTLQAKNALVILYTATAIRADGEYIPGFHIKTTGCEQIQWHRATDAGDGINNRIDVYAGIKNLVQLIADHETTFKQAWNEEPSPLCSLSREVIDVSLNDISEGAEDVQLSSAASESAARKYLSKAVRHPMVIAEGVRLFLKELTARQRVNPIAAGIIFTCNDQGREANEHAKQIEAEIIAQQEQQFGVQIVTMKSEDDQKACERIECFVGRDGKPGKGDILIVKQMGGAGLDAPRLKVILDLSNVRTVASVIQRLMRVATPWERIRTASVIILADPINNEIWRRFIVEEGGEALTTEVCSDWEWQKSYLKEKPDEPGRPLLEVTDAQLASFDDNTGLSGDMARYELVNRLFDSLPELRDRYTKAFMANTPFFRELSGEVPSNNGRTREAQMMDDAIRQKRQEIDRRAHFKAQQESPYNPKNPDPHIERYRHYINRAKQLAGVGLDVHLKQIANTRTLDVMMNSLA